MKIDKELVDRLDGENKKEATEREENTLKSYLDRYDRAIKNLEEGIRKSSTPSASNQRYNPTTLEVIEPQFLTASQVSSAKEYRKQLDGLNETYKEAIAAGTLEAFEVLYQESRNYC